MAIRRHCTIIWKLSSDNFYSEALAVHSESLIRNSSGLGHFVNCCRSWSFDLVTIRDFTTSGLQRSFDFFCGGYKAQIRVLVSDRLSCTFFRLFILDFNVSNQHGDWHWERSFLLSFSSLLFLLAKCVLLTGTLLMSLSRDGGSTL